MMFSKRLAVLTFVLGLGVVSQPFSVRAEEESNSFVPMEVGTFRCPAPSEVKCKSFAESTGIWAQNGGYRQSVNTAFLPNNQCANIIKINQNGNHNRLFCCYKECGVLTVDVKFQDCKKVTVADFHCQ
jgi:hypothetical protein